MGLCPLGAVALEIHYYLTCLKPLSRVAHFYWKMWEMRNKVRQKTGFFRDMV